MDKVTINKHNKTAMFKNASELKAVDKYIFEVTVSKYRAKEVVRNSDEYRVKYQGMDQYLLSCINSNYSSYNKT